MGKKVHCKKLQGKTDTLAHECECSPSHTQSWTIAGQKNEGLLLQAERETCCSWSRQQENAAPSTPVISPILLKQKKYFFFSSYIPPFQILSFYNVCASWHFQPLAFADKTALRVLFSQTGALSCCSAFFFFFLLTCFFKMLKGLFSPSSVLYVFSDQ